MNKNNKFFSGVVVTLFSATMWMPSAQAYFLDSKIEESLLGNSGDATENCYFVR
ncbi:MAG: hypothetical protein ABJA60_11145 [Nitrosospira sp.]